MKKVLLCRNGDKNLTRTRNSSRNERSCQRTRVEWECIWHPIIQVCRLTLVQCHKYSSTPHRRACCHAQADERKEVQGVHIIICHTIWCSRTLGHELVSFLFRQLGCEALLIDRHFKKAKISPCDAACPLVVSCWTLTLLNTEVAGHRAGMVHGGMQLPWEKPTPPPPVQLLPAADRNDVSALASRHTCRSCALRNSCFC